MLYTSRGFRTNRLREVETDDPFEWIAKFKPTKLKLFSVDDAETTQRAKQQIYYFLSGEIKPDENGNITRKDSNVISKDLIVLDYDDLDMQREEFLEHIEGKLKDFSYITYETIRSRPEKVRFRLIIKPERAFSKEENKPLLQQVAALIDLPFDPSSITWSQLQGLPCVFDSNSKTIVHYGNPYPINVDISNATDENTMVEEKKPTLSQRSTTATIKKYIERERENLKDYSNALSCIMVLAKSVQTGEISLESAKRYARMLALGNREWEKNNVKKLENEIKNPDIRTEYSFMEKFSKSTNVKPMETLDCAKELMKTHHFTIVGSNEDSRLHVYREDEGIYTSNLNYIYRLIYQMEPQYTERQVKDVYFKIKMQCDIKESVNYPHLIPVGNGIYNSRTKKLEPFSPDRVFTTKISTNYVENANKPLWDIDAWLNEIACNDKEVVQLLWEIINESLNGNYTRGKYFILVGSGNNGKGTFQQLLINLVGEKNVSTLKMHELSERFKTHQMVGKTLNIGDDIPGGYIDNSSNLQSIATGDYITVEQKGKDPFTVQLKLAMIFSANEIPKMKNKSNGTYRRMVIIPFNADFNGMKEDPTIKTDKLNRQDVLEYVLHKALQMEFETFTVPAVVKAKLEEYKEYNDPIVEFYKHHFLESRISHFDIIPTDYVYKEYQAFCIINGYKSKSQRQFTIDFQDVLGDNYEKKKTRPTVGFYNSTNYKKLSNPVQCFVRIS